jgi:predicted nucleic acid-binding protein
VIVVLDACVLYPPSLRDLLLTLAALDAFDVRWSDDILDEVRRNVVADHPDVDEERFVEHTIGAMRGAFPEASVRVPPELVETLDNDPKNRHVAAVALAGSADAIVTLNVGDFESSVLRNANVEILTPGVFVNRMFSEFPDVVARSIGHLADRWTRPSRTTLEIIELLAAHPSMADPMGALRDYLGS